MRKARRFLLAGISCGLLAAALPQPVGAQSSVLGTKTYAGFDRNDYPGDAALDGLRRSFAFTGYWLNAPPGEAATSWTGKRAALESRGFGFLLLFNGRLAKEIADFQRTSAAAQEHSAAALGAADAKLAVAAARREGFPMGAVIFLDQEEGGRLTEDQTAYLFAWADGVRDAGFRAGVYCSGIQVPEGRVNGKRITISTADDIAAKAAGVEKSRSGEILLWVYEDACPPSPGCSVAEHAPPPSGSGTASAVVWQYAQSPRRKPIANGCAGYSSADNRCYAPGMEHGEQTFVDMDAATSTDPSEGRGKQ